MSLLDWTIFVESFVIDHPEFQPYLSLARPMQKKSKKESFRTFVEIIIYQAIRSDICAKMVENLERLMRELHQGEWTPEILFSLTEKQWKEKVHLSQKKIEAIQNLCSQFSQKNITERLYSDQSVEKILQEIHIKGVGAFTIKYFLYEHVARLDIAMFEDIVVRRGLKYVYHLKEVPSLKEAEKLCKQWGPLASIGSSICYALGHL